MVAKRCKRLVFSVYSHELEDYPYYPFLANNLSDGVKRFVRFCRDKESICPGAELHWIGTCECYWNNDKDTSAPVLENIQPLAFPQRVKLSENWLGHITSRCFILGVLYHDKVVNYLENIFSKKGLKNGKIK